MSNQIQGIVFDPAKLRAARVAKFPDRSQRNVALDLLGISPQRLHRYENGEDKPSPTLLAQMCRLYSVELLELTTEKIPA